MHHNVPVHWSVGKYFSGALLSSKITFYFTIYDILVTKNEKK